MSGLADFRASLAAEAPPEGASLALQSLWWDARGNWDRAHECAQEQDDTEGAWVHAYLHRREGDIPNARYWYARAGKSLPPVALGEEWAAITEALLTRG